MSTEKFTEATEINALLKQLTTTTDSESQSALRIEILKLYFYKGYEAYSSGDFKIALQLWQQGITHAEQFLQQGETAVGVREQVLKLYVNTGTTQGQLPLADVEKAMAYYQRGLEHAEQFLQQGETAVGVREQVLILYYNQLVTWYDNDQITSVIQSLPLLGLWSWDSLPYAKQKNVILRNWHTYLDLSPTPTKVTTAFCQAFETVFWRWHQPSKAHRHC